MNMLDRFLVSVRLRAARVPRLVRRLAPVALTAALFAVAGALWPLRGSLSSSVAERVVNVPVAAATDETRLDGFLAMPRWGRPAYDAERARLEAEAAAAAAAAATGLNPELARLGVVGITASAGSRAVLLTRPGGTVRLVDGDSLPDGRVLVSVTANALVLETADGLREELLLFHRLAEAVDVGKSPEQNGDFQ